MITKLGAEGFELVKRVEIEQGFVDVDKLVGQVMRIFVESRKVVIAMNAGGKRKCWERLMYSCRVWA